MVFAFYTLKTLTTDTGDGPNFSGGKKEGQIAVVEVEGVIMDSKDVVEKLHLARDSKDIKAIIVRIDSPGGAVGPSQEIYEEIKKIDTDEENGKPVYASFGSVAASGGYYIAAATRKIYSNPGTLTGSIGVIMQFVNVSKLLEWVKVDPVTIKAGRYKDIGAPNRAMTVEERSLMEKLLASVHTQFRDHILATRKDKIKGNLEELTQGQIFSGKEAMDLGLVDEVAGLWEAGRRIQAELKLEGKFGLKFIKKKKKFSFMEFMEDMDSVLQKFKMTGLSPSNIPMFLFSN